ncbi:thermonuclease family protein [Lacibacter luteus]|uniref:Thermonuclease family protein n=2 Tax=Lacibacter luteus TaxID=2508719 RepID=A0A4V1M7F1_9BACT|nr:thermonuclease family protein [Lacibacter luteus]
MKYMRFVVVFLLLLPLPALTAPSYTLTGKAVRIVDGDTFDLLVDKTTYRIRLAGIDAPEKGQDFGNASKQLLGTLCKDELLTVVVTDTDRNKRKIAEVYTSKKVWINKEMIAKGMAWHFVKYSANKELAAAEQQARKNKVGLWNASNAVAPWEWRKKRRG